MIGKLGTTINEKSKYETILLLNVLKPINPEITTGTSSNIVIEIREIGGQDTTGDIVFRVTKPAGFSISYNPSLTVGNNPASNVDNTFRTVSVNDLGFLIEITVVAGALSLIPSYGKLYLGITFTATGSTGQTGNSTIGLNNGTGGSTRNTPSESINVKVVA